MAAPPLRAVWWSRRPVLTGLAAALLVALVGAAPLLPMVAIYGGLAVLLTTMLSPTVGLYLLLASIPFSPTFGLEDAAFTISIFEPLALLIVLFWLLRGLTRHDIRLPREGLFGAFGVFLAILLLSAGGATSFPLAIKELLKWALMLLAYVFVRVTVRDERDARGILTALFFAAAGQAFMGLVQFVLLMGPPGFALGPFIRAHGMFGQPNPFAGYLGTVLPLALALAAVPHVGRFRAIAAFAALMTGLGIVLSFSRGAWLGIAISLGIMALAWSGRARQLLVPLLGVLALVVTLAYMGLLPPALAARITSIGDTFGVFDVRTVTLTSENFAVVERMAHWQAGWWMFLDYPLLGVGPGNYPAVYDRYYIHPWKEPLGHAHNYYLNMAAEAGVPGLAALLLVLGLAFRSILRRARLAAALDQRPTDLDQLAPRPVSAVPAFQGTDPHTPEVTALDPAYSPRFARALALGLLGSLAVFCIHNLFDNLLVHGVGIQIGVLLGLIGGQASR